MTIALVAPVQQDSAETVGFLFRRLRESWPDDQNRFNFSHER